MSHMGGDIALHNVGDGAEVLGCRLPRRGVRRTLPPDEHHLPRREAQAHEGGLHGLLRRRPRRHHGRVRHGEEASELGDLWHLKWVRTGHLGQLDDGYLDHTRFDAEKAKNAGRKTDPKTGGGYDDNKLVNGKPEFMNKDGKPGNKGGTYWIKAEDKVAFDDAKFKPGDEVASIVVAPFVGDRGDVKIAASGRKENGPTKSLAS
ncbi:MAG: hypothetical protein Q8O25_10960 [Sulfurisoma sp.]|nr:hypothetical protein [Sulfurisoma sp.]